MAQVQRQGPCQPVAGRYQNRVRACRLRYGVDTQKRLAMMTRIARTTISLLENNKLFLSSYHALLIRDALGCTLDELYEVRPRPGGDDGNERRARR
jgi:transcriptional regulator with XRE-family HTH domain